MKKNFSCILCFLLSFIGGYIYTHINYSPIPKIIHYVWLGKTPLPETAQKMIKSWQKQAPDYRIIEWNEKNCDIDANHYVKWAYKNKLYAFASDWCRFNALYKYGGLYLDNDHELTKNPSHILRQTQLVMVYESKNKLSGSFIAAIKGHPFIKEMIRNYQQMGPNTSVLPTHLTHLYHTHFTHPLNGLKYTSKTLSLLPTNIAMLDFGGGENIAIHHYDGTDTLYKDVKYYHYFSKLFLMEMSIPVFIHNRQDYLILSDDKNGYFLESNEKVKIIHKTDTTLSIKKAGQIYHLHFKDGCFKS